jgi:ribonucleotide monophosphatase NagD (HAD superfamily)
MRLNSANVASWIDSYDTFIFDCDGVLWCGPHQVPGANSSLKLLREKVHRCANELTVSGKTSRFRDKQCHDFQKSVPKEDGKAWY